MNKIIKRGLILLGTLFLVLVFIRIISPTEIDDIHPDIPCPELNIYEPDILWVIPLYQEKGISEPENKEWCEEILSLNKTIGMHGVSHSYKEFGENRDSKYLQNGIEEFEGCFGYKPEIFKSPQLMITPENKQLIRENGLVLKDLFNQIIHKVYHCKNMCKIPNWLMYSI